MFWKTICLSWFLKMAAKSEFISAVSKITSPLDPTSNKVAKIGTTIFKDIKLTT
jgi:hypothetical protein